jgi:hypothetical protein
MLLFNLAGYAMNIIEVIFAFLIIAFCVDILLLHKKLDKTKVGFQKIEGKLNKYIALLDKENERLKVLINKAKKACTCGAWNKILTNRGK